MKIHFSAEDLAAAEAFSTSVDTSFYSTRGQSDNTKRKLDSKIGKLGEFAAYHVLKTIYPNVSLPDCKIYKAKEKSWAADLSSPCGKQIHVKAQDSRQSEKYSASWIFQSRMENSYRSYDKEIFDNVNSEDLVAFVIVNMATNSAEVKAIVPVSLLHKHELFAEMKLPQMRAAAKKAVYFKDLENHKEAFIKLSL